MSVSGDARGAGARPSCSSRARTNASIGFAVAAASRTAGTRDRPRPAAATSAAGSPRLPRPSASAAPSRRPSATGASPAAASSLRCRRWRCAGSSSLLPGSRGLTIAQPSSSFLNSALARVEPQLRLALGGVRPVAAEAAIREQRADLAVEVDARRGRRRLLGGPEQDRQPGDRRGQEGEAPHPRDQKRTPGVRSKIHADDVTRFQRS